MDSTMVIKVKYGDALRRFSAFVDGNNRLDLNLVGLRAKICSIFNFPADANLILRYVDEDGDLVNLVDDNDLHDVMRQQLKFLRIDVQMTSDSDGKSDSGGSSGSATPLRSPASIPFSIENFVKADVLSAVPEPLREALYSSLTKAASSSPVLANLADSISKIGESILTSQFPPHVKGGTSSKDAAPEESVTTEAAGLQPRCVDSASNANDSARPGGSAIPLKSPVLDPYDVSEPLPEALSNLSLSKGASSSHMLPNPTVAAGLSSKKDVLKEPATSEARGIQSPLASNANWKVEAGNSIRGNMTPSNGSGHVEAGNQIRGVVTSSGAIPQLEPQNVGVIPVDLNTPPCESYSPTNANWAPLSSNIPPYDSYPPINVTWAPHSSAVPSSDNKGKVTVGAKVLERCQTSTNSGRSKTRALRFGPLAPIDYPFSGTHSLHSMPPRESLGLPSFISGHSHTEAMNGLFHRGVRCDGCGVYPITGPRFKSKVKVDYDLCSICFNEIGNQLDYFRIDRPESVRGPRCGSEITMGAWQQMTPRQQMKQKQQMVLPHTFKPSVPLKHAKPKLDSRFILDVNVIDGTMMAPSTAFTKIWRMRNTGTLVWPKGAQLVWIGGDQFSDSFSVDLEVPKDGLPVEKELDIAVDFRAPQLPGRYISYWRMETPTGVKYGQRVWVLIQVDASLKDSFYDSSQGLNLNIPLDVGGSKGSQIIDINVQPIEDDTIDQPINPNAPPEPVNQMLDEEPKQGNRFATNEATFVGPAASPAATSSSVSYPSIGFSSTTSLVPSPVSYPIVDAPAVPSIGFSNTTSLVPSPVSYPIVDAPAVPSNQQASTVDALSSSPGVGENDNLEEALLKELEQMGFKQVDLNKEILRMNEYNLEQSVDDLCGVSEWDPILEELHAMGFHDKEVNKRLLMKNNGSIKGVVMDLINGE